MKKDYCDDGGLYYYMDGCNGLGYYEPKDYYYYRYNFFGKCYFVHEIINDILECIFFRKKIRYINNDKTYLYTMIMNDIEKYKDIYEQDNGIKIKKDNLIKIVYNVFDSVREKYKMYDENIVCGNVRDNSERHMANMFVQYANKT